MKRPNEVLNVIIAVYMVALVLSGVIFQWSILPYLEDSQAERARIAAIDTQLQTAEGAGAAIQAKAQYVLGVRRDVFPLFCFWLFGSLLLHLAMFALFFWFDMLADQSSNSSSNNGRIEDGSGQGSGGDYSPGFWSQPPISTFDTDWKRNRF
jgi:hypothetical protein